MNRTTPRPTRSDLSLVLLGGLGMLSCLSCNTIRTTEDQFEERILLSSERDGNSEIYIMNPDGTEIQRLTNHPAADLHAVLSPDGNEEIYIMNSDCTGQVRITDNPTPDLWPTWGRMRR